MEWWKGVACLRQCRKRLNKTAKNAGERSERTSARVYDSSKQVVGDDGDDCGEIPRGELLYEFVTLLRLRCVAAIVVVVGSGTFWWVHFSISLHKYLNILV